ncbi:hypothetical protein SPRG_14180 [Saprolegnia parasitica CBS 223.65]|uniref:Uncharacterized protein n=1 Tax=Saprolegnia parasitica (strain CBS 223.65) TaxID=695850 RepID=A0A067BZM9_SAPPC|nr:hypothetical protein SPRG_14180 [Saprolegnia parasitica CBS 223.65]KDO20032.1 hypothetical protein SPRG_14180 [Saprolegnia parasitica CBS 223.65]|eukprot:XP_012209266.1 hypothetical protein SPRG_14180 [Saprolegnia parasitica CBS 223.65]
MGDDANTPRARKLAHDRDAKRLQRQAYIDEVSALRQSILDLTRQLYVLRGTLVAWQDVAHELHHVSEVTRLENQQLHDQVAQYRRLANHLHDWIRTMTPSTDGARLSPSPWPEVTLPRHEDIRHIGFRWLAQQLLTAAEANLAPSFFPQTHEDSIKVEWGRKGRKFIFQKVLHAPSAMVSRAIWAMNGAEGPRSLTAFDDHEPRVQVLHAETNDTHQLSYIQESLGNIVVQRVFHVRIFLDERTVIAHRTIASDEALQPYDHDESFQEWCGFANFLVRPHGQSIRLFVGVRFSSLAAYMQTLYPAQYALALANEDGHSEGSPSWEPYLHRVMLTYGIACARQCFEVLERVLAHSVLTRR